MLYLMNAVDIRTSLQIGIADAKAHFNSIMSTDRSTKWWQVTVSSVVADISVQNKLVHLDPQTKTYSLNRGLIDLISPRSESRYSLSFFGAKIVPFFAHVSFDGEPETVRQMIRDHMAFLGIPEKGALEQKQMAAVSHKKPAKNDNNSDKGYLIA